MKKCYFLPYPGFAFLFRNAIFLILPFFCLIFFSYRLNAQNYIVNSNADTHASNTTTGVDGSGNITLRSALEAATATSGTHSISFSGVTQISLTLGSITVGNISAGNNISITGPSQNPVTISQTTASQVFITGTGAITFSLSNLNLNYNGPTGSGNVYSGGGGAIQAGDNGASTTLTNVTISNFTQQIGDGGAIDDGAAGSQTLTLTNCVFQNNSCANGTGGGGAVAFLTTGGTATITGCRFTGNSSPEGGALNLSGAGNGGTYNVTQCTFINNSVPTGGQGGAIINTNGTLNANYNRFVGNTAGTPANGNTIAQAAGTTVNVTNATNNWWGQNSGPATNDVVALASNGDQTPTVTSSPYLVIRASASPNPICAVSGGLVGNTSTITASFLTNSAGSAISTSNLGALVDLGIGFTVQVGSLSSTLAPIAANGTATVTYTANGLVGVGTVNCMLDNLVAVDPTGLGKASISVNSLASITLQPTTASASQGGSVTFTVNATGYPAPTYQWYNGTTPLTDGATGSGSTITGSGADQMTISGIGEADVSSNYNVVVSNSCASVQSNLVSLKLLLTTITNLASDANPSVTGNVVTFSAIVTSPANHLAVNSGTVTLMNNGVPVSSSTPNPVAVSASQALFSVNFPTQGAYNLSAVYQEGNTYAGSAGYLTQVVNNPTIVNGNQFCNTGGFAPSGQGSILPYPSTITVSGLSGTISGLTVTLDGLTVSNPSAAGLLLVGPGGQSLPIMAGAGGSASIGSPINIIISDAASSTLPQSTTISSGTYKPTDYNNALSFPSPAPALGSTPQTNGSATLNSVFGNTNPNGAWNLYVVDPGDNTLNISGGWCLTINTASPGPTASVLGLSTDGSGASAICAGSSSSLAVNITGGVTPYTVVYSDGTANHTVSNYTSGADISVTPTATTTYSLVSVTDANNNPGSGNTGAPQVTVYQPPVAGIILNVPPVCAGNNEVTLVLSGSTGNIQWLSSTDNVNFNPIITGLASNLTVAGLNATTYYKAVLTSAGCPSVTTATTTVTVDQLPQIGPISGVQEVCAGDNNLILVLSGSTGSIQWQSSTDNVHFSPVNNATGSDLTISNLNVNTYYEVVLSNPACPSLTTPSVEIPVEQPPVAGTISGAQEVCAGTNSATLNLTGYTGSVQWYSSTDGVNFSPISDATGATYIASGLTATTYYEAVVSSGVCPSVTSPSVTVTVDQPPVAGTISGAQEVCAGSNTTNLSLTGYTGSIQWYSSTDGVNFSPVSNATGATYTASGLTATTYYEAVVSSGVCPSVTSPSVTVTVDQAPVAGAISGAREVCAGTNTTNLSLTGYTGSIQWYSSADGVNFSPIANATGAAYTASNLSATTYYEAQVSNGVCASEITPAVTVAVDPPPVAGLISGASPVCAGTNTTNLSLTGYSGSIQWYSSTDGVNFSPIANATGATYTASNLSSTTYYETVVSNGVCASVTTPAVTVTVNPLPSGSISVTGSPVCLNGTPSPSITFTGSGGTAPYSFTYTLSNGSSTTAGLNAPGGSPSTTISAPTGTVGVYTYTLTQVTDASSTTCSQNINSQSAIVTINPLPGASIAINTNSVCQNGASPDITFTGSGGTAPYTYTYNINGNATSLSLSDNGSGSVVLPVSTGTPGNYTYTLTNVQDANGCSPQSITGQSVNISVNALPVATINTASMVTAVSTGNTASVANAGSGSSYTWTIGNGNITGGTGTNSISYMAGATGNVSLSVAVTSPSGCGPVSSGTIEVPITALPCPKAEITVASAVCTGSSGNQASVASVAGNVYTWTISNGNITAGANSSSVTYTAGATGTVLLSVSVTNASGQCTVSSGTYHISIIPLPLATIFTAPAACSGSAGNIAWVPYAGPGASYAWTISNGTITAGSGTAIIQYKAGSSGSVTLSVTVTNLTGCKASSGSKSVSISAYPVATITAATGVCAGSSSNTASVASAGSGAHYLWGISNGCITAGSSTSSVSYSAGQSGVATLWVTVVNSSGCSVASAKKLVTIVGAPSAVIKASASVCAASTGNTASVASAGTGAVYAWTISNGTIIGASSAASITYAAGQTGFTTLAVTVTNSTGCKASSGNKEIIISSLPAASITAAASVCSASTGNTASVTSAGSGATYAWTIGNGTISSGSGTNPIKYTAGSSGSVTLAVTVTNSGGCKAGSGNKLVPINAKTTPTFTAIAAICLDATPPALPSVSNNGISGTWNPSKISATATGTKSYTFTPAAGACASAVSINVTVQKCTTLASVSDGGTGTGAPEKTAAAEKSGEELTAVVFPNPSTIGFRLELKSTVRETVDILVMDLLGNPIYHTRGEATGSYLFGERFVKGMYFVVVIHQDGIRTLKIIKQ